MQFENLEAIIDFAIDKEDEAVQFYMDASKETAMSGSKEMLLEFADEERRHARMLTELKAKGVVEGIDRYKLKWITDMKRSDYTVDAEYKAGMAYHEILMVAMKKEEKALKLYNELLERTEVAEARKLFKLLCQEEAKHKLKFETMYDDYMAEMGD